MISIIAAMDKKRGIGKEGAIPWYIPEDFKHFKKTTMHHPVIMGRRTFESIGKVLPGRANIIVSKKLNDKTSVENVYWAASIKEAIDKASEKEGGEEIFVIGGGQIYKEVLEKRLVDKMYLTIIDSEFDTDTYFPEYSGFKEIERKESDNGIYKFSFVELEKK